MRKIVEFKLLSPLMCGGVKVSDNFLESESFIRGSVIRAAFANDILLECPLANMPSKEGQLNYIELKEPEGKCADCPKKEICSKFSDMYFSFAYPAGCIPAPMTLIACKTAGLEHKPKDIIYRNDNRSCSCQGGRGRMESFKGWIRPLNDGSCEEVKVGTILSTHTSIDYHSHTAEDGKLFSVRAVDTTTDFTAVIDDLDSGMLYEGKEIYIGKYVSVGYGKVRITSIKEQAEITEKDISRSLENFSRKLDAPNKAALLFLSDAVLDFKGNEEKTDSHRTKGYLDMWQRAILGSSGLPIKVEKVYAETQLYSGYDTSQKWGEWKFSEPELHVLKGTSVLLDISECSREQAIAFLTKSAKEGIGSRTKDGYGAIAVCHELHQLGVCSHE